MFGIGLVNANGAELLIEGETPYGLRRVYNVGATGGWTGGSWDIARGPYKEVKLKLDIPNSLSHIPMVFVSLQTSTQEFRNAGAILHYSPDDGWEVWYGCAVPITIYLFERRDMSASTGYGFTVYSESGGVIYDSSYKLLQIEGAKAIPPNTTQGYSGLSDKVVTGLPILKKPAIAIAPYACMHRNAQGNGLSYTFASWYKANGSFTMEYKMQKTFNADRDYSWGLTAIPGITLIAIEGERYD